MTEQGGTVALKDYRILGLVRTTVVQKEGMIFTPLYKFIARPYLESSIQT